MFLHSSYSPRKVWDMPKKTVLKNTVVSCSRKITKQVGIQFSYFSQSLEKVNGGELMAKSLIQRKFF